MPYPLKELEPARSLRDWFGAEVRHWRLRRNLKQDALGLLVHVSGDLIGKVERAERTCSAQLAGALDAALDTGGVLTRIWPMVAGEADRTNGSGDGSAGDALSAVDASPGRSMRWSSLRVEPVAATGTDVSGLPLGDEGVASRSHSGEAGDSDPMRRRALSQMLGTAALSAVLGGLPASLDPMTAVGDRLLGLDCGPAEPQPSSTLRIAVDRAKRDYQCCRYRALAARLPTVVAACRATAASATDEEQQRAYAMLAETYHVATSLLLKLGDHALACMTADRSVHAAEYSEDDLAVGSAARIFAHALLAAGHGDKATEWAVAAAGKLSATKPTPAALSVQGALLLRGAVAAARQDDRGTALDLLDEADATAQRLGRDSNHYWTAFGPTNVLLHRVSIATALGDAGAALDHARRVDLDHVHVTERRASFWLDVARASHQRGRLPQTLTALREAERCAPEEVHARPVVRQLLADMRTRPRVGLDGLDAFAARVGAVSS